MKTYFGLYEIEYIDTAEYTNQRVLVGVNQYETEEEAIVKIPKDGGEYTILKIYR